MAKIKNKFDVSVSFDDHAFRVTSRPDVVLTPSDVMQELREIVERIKRTLAKATRDE